MCSRRLRKAKELKPSLFLLVLLNLLLVGFIRWDFVNSRGLNPKALIKTAQVFGGSPRSEREYKLSIQGDGANLSRLKSVEQAIGTALVDLIKSGQLSSGQLFKGVDFTLTGGGAPMVFRDIYFDTEDQTNAKNDLILRARHRWSSLETFDSFLRGSRETQHLPHRFEIQTKTDKNRLSDGLSQVTEVRVDLSTEPQLLPGDLATIRSPWPIHQYLSLLKTGTQNGWALSTHIAYSRALARHQDLDSVLYLKPSVVVYTLRSRFHLNLKTPWGSGPNPEQAYVISIDLFWAKPFEDIEASSSRISRFSELMLKFSDAALEVEIEFERNVSEKLELAVKTGDATAIAAETTFHSDLNLIARHLKDQLSKAQIPVVYFNLGKYAQALKMLGQQD